EAIRQAYLVGTDIESEPFEGEARTPESPHIVAPPTCHVDESECYGTSGVRSTSSDSIASLSPDHPLTHTTPVLVPILRRTARMVVRVPPVMSPGLSAGMAEVAAMKRYRGTSELIFGTDSKEDEEVDESSYSDSKSEDVEDEGPTIEDEDPAAEDEATAVGEPLGLGYEALRNQELALKEDHVYSTFEVGQGSGSALEPERSKRVSAFRQPTLTT
nr:hypothetical protein [Tanacetum cinerariifolium]